MKPGPYPVALRIKMLREAGQVRRFHTLPHVGSYSLAEHQWQCVVLLLQLHPRPPIQLIEAMLLHDVPERWTGDAPNPVKVGAPMVKAALDRTEELLARHLCIEAGHSLTGEEIAWLRAIDSLELLQWCHDQLTLGNRGVQQCIDSALRWFERNKADVPPQVLTYLASSPFAPWERTPEWLLP